MAPVNANDINEAKAFVPAKKALPEVETENGNNSTGYVSNFFKRVFSGRYFQFNSKIIGIR